MKIKGSIVSLLFVAAVGMGGCGAKFPPPTSELELATTAITQAESSGAYETAPIELRSARDKLSQAKQAVQQEDNITAKRLAEQAIADANLAEAKAKTAKTKTAEKELQESIRILREETDRKMIP